MADKYRWIATNTPLAGRYDDCVFLNKDLGWAINGAGHVYRTENGARTWERQKELRQYLRCLGMLPSGIGWIGSVTPGKQLFVTNDGGKNWAQVPNLPTRYNDRHDADAPRAVCGLFILDDRHIFASGTNSPEDPPRFMKSTDGGSTWWARDMQDVASALIDIFFQSPDVGWVVGGRGMRPKPQRADLLPVVLKTEDGGRTWRNMIGPEVNPPLGEWGWKIQLVDDSFVVVACENFACGAILVSDDGGATWQRHEIRDAAGQLINANLEGVGFVNKQTGWVGGWGDVSTSSGRTSGTTDGGVTWTDLTTSWPRPLDVETVDLCANDIDRGQYLNRFRVVGDFVYASGNTVYNFTDENADDFKVEVGQRELIPAQQLRYGSRALIPISVRVGTKALRIEIFDRFAGKVRTFVDETDPASGQHDLVWDLTDDAGRPVAARQFLVRATADGVSEARLMVHEGIGAGKTLHPPHMLARLDR